MRGKAQPQSDFFATIDINKAVPPDHPLRAIKLLVDPILKKLSPEFDVLYADEGRPSIPPEQLLKARLLIALFSVRSERSFCEQLGYNLLWLWFLDRQFDEGSFDASVFAKNYQRILNTDMAKLFFAEIYQLSRDGRWTSDEHFSADGTLIESWVSLKSFTRKDGSDQQKIQSAKDDDPGNPTLDFRGEKRCNATHRSTTDPESVLYKKAAGKEARLYFGGHILMENRNGLCADFTIHNPITESESQVALLQIKEHKKIYQGTNPKTLGADKAYHQKRFVEGCRKQGISPHAACKDKVTIEGLDARTTTKSGYKLSLKIRKRIEEIFGWIKTVGGLRRSRYRGIERTQAIGYMVAGAYNLLRLAKLGAKPC